MQVIIEHDFHCPLGAGGLRAFSEAAEALANMPPEARQTRDDLIALSQAWANLQAKQECNCGATAEIERRRKEFADAEPSPAP